MDLRKIVDELKAASASDWPLDSFAIGLLKQIAALIDALVEERAEYLALCEDWEQRDSTNRPFAFDWPNVPNDFLLHYRTQAKAELNIPEWKGGQ